MILDALMILTSFSLIACHGWQVDGIKVSAGGSEKDLLRTEAVREGENRFRKFQSKFQSKANFSDEKAK